ncbi:putative ABC transporter permease [Clostridium sp. WILCCON 0269]|uniref:ABC transporter permease n=1 Tax=Candidatus Clostridium eludens TaxID=3381663 RepID=A0ABW8SN51_9CLOT
MQNLTILGFSLYDILFYIAIYGFLGWCLEVVYSAVNTGGFINRGFLNGPICPIYGFGSVIVIVCFTPFKNNLLLLFLGSVFVTSLLEYITGFILEKVFYNKWWDYSNMPFNINGYICLKFSLAWGAACIFLIKVFHPMISSIVGLIPYFLGNVFLVIIISLFIVDLVTSINTVLKLNIRLEKIQKICAKIKEKSNALGEDISEEALEFKKKYENFSKETIELKRRYINLMKKSNRFYIRLIKAFPHVKSTKYFDALEVLKRSVIYKKKGKE